MESNPNSNLFFEKNEYKFKLLFLIRKYLPKSEFLYLLMFALKYIGLILFSISLNVYDTRNNNNNINNNSPQNFAPSTHDPPDNRGRNPMGDKSNSNESSKNSVQNLFKKLLINGSSYKILIESYQIICFIGFIILIIYICLWIFIFFYMRKKYYRKTSITITDRLINQINQTDTFEKRFIRFLTYFLFLIIFFHQYILEYYTFGFLGYILNHLGALNNKEEMNSNDENYNSYTKYINEHLGHFDLPEILTIVTNLLTMNILFILFIAFMLINSAKTLYINNNYPIYSDYKNLIINLIFLNLNPIYGIINYFNDETKLNIALIFVIIIVVLF